MTICPLIPAPAGIQTANAAYHATFWVPAFAARIGV